MEGGRAAKRRKLDTPNKLSTQSSSAARLAELRQSRSAKQTTSVNGSSAPLEESPSIGNGKRKLAGRSTKAEEDATNGLEAQNGHSEAGVKVHVNGNHYNGEDADVEMADADTIAVNQNYNNENHGEREESQPRTSGRKRQVSRKLQDALEKESPVPAARRKGVRTPIKEVKDSQVKVTPKSTKPKSTPKTENLSAIKTTSMVPEPAERTIEDSVTEDADAMELDVVPVQSTPQLSAAKVAKQVPRELGLTKVTNKTAPATKELVLDSQAAVTEPILEAAHLLVSRVTFEEEEDPVEVLPEGYDFPLEDLTTLQQIVMGRLAGRAPTRLVGLKDEYIKIAALIEQTIVAGESNSMMIIGARGSGKTAIVEQILREQTARQSNDFHTVRLSGFTHTDDKIALREIWRQLGREMEVEDDHLAKNYADTLTTLLALLSHPSEHGEQQAGQTARSVIIILDEFELFASHPRQTLLYNLFDIAQSRKAPIAVLGLTTRFDVAESLEKRVKSRFSHRKVHLPLARDFASFKEMCKSSLIIRNDDLAPTELNARMKASSVDAGLDASRKAWNGTVVQVLDKSEPFNNHIFKIYYHTKSVGEFNTSMLLPIASLPTEETRASSILDHLATSVTTTSSLNAPDSKLSLLSSLSTLQLCLLIAAARLSIIHDTDTSTFALAYDEYKNLASRARIQASAAGAMAMGNSARVWAKETARSAWQGLVELELIMPVNEVRSTGRQDGLCRVDVGLEEIGLSGVELTAVMSKWCKEI